MSSATQDEQRQAADGDSSVPDIRQLFQHLTQTSTAPSSYYHLLCDDVAGQETLIKEVEAGASPEHIGSSVASPKTLELLFREHHLPRIRDVVLGHAIVRLKSLLGDDLIDDSKLSAPSSKLAQATQLLGAVEPSKAPELPKLPIDALIAHIERSKLYGDLHGDPEWEDEEEVKKWKKHTWRGRLETAIEQRQKALDAANQAAPWEDSYAALDQLIQRSTPASLLSAVRAVLPSTPQEPVAPMGPGAADASPSRDFTTALEASGSSFRRALMQELVAHVRNASEPATILGTALLSRSRILASEEAMLLVDALSALSEAEAAAGSRALALEHCDAALALEHCDAALAILAAFRGGSYQPDTFGLINGDPSAVLDVMKGVQPRPKRPSTGRVAQEDVDEAREKLLKRKQSFVEASGDKKA